MKTSTTQGNAEILLADDDLSVRKSYRLLFENEGYTVRVARQGEEAVRMFTERRPDLVLLDVMMPKMNGILACQEIRKIDKLTPILFFTAMPSDVTLVRGLGCGADDYIDKSRSPEEFLARVACALRRRTVAAEAAKANELVRLGRVTVDLANFYVLENDVQIARLTKAEACIFRALLANRGAYLSNDQLFSALRGEAMSGDIQQVRTYMSLLRAKLGHARDLIQNAHGIGYRLMD